MVIAKKLGRNNELQCKRTRKRDPSRGQLAQKGLRQCVCVWQLASWCVVERGGGAGLFRLSLLLLRTIGMYTCHLEAWVVIFKNAVKEKFYMWILYADTCCIPRQTESCRLSAVITQDGLFVFVFPYFDITVLVEFRWCTSSVLLNCLSNIWVESSYQ